MRKLILILVCALAGYASADAKKENPVLQEVEFIKKHSDNYMWGSGRGNDPEAAMNAALFDLARQISTKVWGMSDETITDGYDENGQRVSSDMFSSVVKSYTAPASLKGVKTIVLSDGPVYERFVYIPRANVEQMHERRERQVADLARDGIRARDNGKVDDALRYLYRSYVLLQTLPSASEVKSIVDGEERTLKTWIPEAMRDIVNKVSFGIASIEDDPEMGTKSVELTVKYNGEKATTCTFRYATANGMLSEEVTARDGMASIDLDAEDADTPMKPLKLYVEYLFKNENHTDPELRSMLDAFDGSGLVKNEYTVNTKKKLKADKAEAKEFQRLVSAGAYEEVASVGADASAPYAEAMAEIISCISGKRIGDVRKLCTEEGWMLFEKLMGYGKVKILGKPTPDTYAFYPYRDEVICRSVPMSFTFGSGSSKRTFTEDIVFTFNSDAKLVSVSLGLGSIARKDIFEKKGAAWTDEKKMELVNFLENYRTAFALKQLGYIESIFDDDAVIIVGHINKRLERVKGIDGFALASKEDFIQTQLSKKGYLERMRRVFDSQEYVNVRFTDTDVERSGVGGDTYAIQLKQDYVSTTYGDQGYLFLFVDFNDPDKPLIHVRTWQPERNPDLTPNLPPDHPRAGIFSPASF